MNIDPKIYQQLLETFQIELKEHHETIVNNLILLETEMDEKKLEEILQTLFRAAHNIKGAAKSVSLHEVSTIAHHLEDQFNEWKEQKKIPKKIEINNVLKEADTLFDAIRKNIDKKNQSEEKNMTLKIPANRVDQANAKVDEILTLRFKLENTINKINKQHKSEQNNIEKLSQLISDSQMQLTYLDTELQRSLKALQSDLRDMRLLPIEILLNPLKRTTHDIAQSLNKNVYLDFEGGEIELDKSVIDLLKDPLQHLIRNAIDHGIENEGKIHIKVTSESGKIQLIFSDNGRGIDIDSLKNAALRAHLTDAPTLGRLSQGEILDFIFWPGISTHKNVTEISGRGVGLDVVRKNIELAKGSIQVKTSHQGTHFTLTVPLTLAVEQGLFLSTEEQEFVFPSTACSGIINVVSDAIKSVETDTVYIHKKEPISVRPLNAILNIKSVSSEQRKKQFGILLIRNQKKILILVDQVLNEHNYIIKPLPYPITQLHNIAGTTLTIEGKLILVLDPVSLFESAIALQAASKGEYISDKHPSQRIKKILVVEDSLTTRNLIINALTATGFIVQGAKHGHEAIKYLKKENFDIVISDIEMPKMNGYELTRFIKSHNKFNDIPVLIVTSHESEEEKRQAFEAGADKFLIKSEFDTISLIKTIKSIL